MADIFEIAKTYGEADYYDMVSGNTYLIAEYNRAKRFGLPTVVPGIRVMRDGQVIGYVKDPELFSRYFGTDANPTTIGDSSEENYYTNEASSFKKMSKTLPDGFSGKFKCSNGLTFIIYNFNKDSNVLQCKFTNVNNVDIDSESVLKCILDANDDGYIKHAWLEDIIGTLGGCRLVDKVANYK